MKSYVIYQGCKEPSVRILGISSETDFPLIRKKIFFHIKNRHI